MKNTNIMPDKRILILITIITVLAAVICCITSCKSSRPDKLRFIGGVESTPPPSATLSLVVATHGWIEKAKGDWPEDAVAEIHRRVDPNFWICGYFDWSAGAATINPTDAARYARDIAGPDLAEKILALDAELQHIHLIAHSGGCWAISEAAKILAEKTTADIHLTFLDAYVPRNWHEDSLGDINIHAGAKYWADHYYTRDYTFTWTQHDLTFAHNVDVTKLDQGIKDHNFPWRWYYATITGRYPTGYFLDNRKLVQATGATDYGFARSKEAPIDNSWHSSLQLPIGNKAVKLTRSTKDMTGQRKFFHK